ncbi:MAG TPA: HAMP domain-containing histidine kinase [bacterium]|nr:HAMP domain-containing histidine kinase [bacterium]
MKYRRALRWQIFGGLAAVLVINFFLIDLFVITIAKNTLDSELNNRMDMIGESLEKQVSPLVFMLSPDDRLTGFHQNYMSILETAKETWGVDITFINTAGRRCISTLQETLFLDTYILPTGENYSVTYRDGVEYVKDRVYYYGRESGEIKGYIMLRLKGGPLAFFGEMRSRQAAVMAALFVPALLFALGFSFLITRRIDYTVAQMERMSGGGGPVVLKDGPNDEFSYLLKRINALVARLKELEESRYKEVQAAAMGLAHEVRNPAAAIYSLAELASRSNPGKAAAEKLGKIREEVSRLNIITERFVQFARDNAVEKAGITAGSLVKPLLDGFPGLRALYPGIRGDAMMISADEVLLNRALVNIIKNSYEAGAKDVEVCFSLKAGAAVIEISDNAPLIPDAAVESIFVPFFTTKQGGMGIGLAITKIIIEKHGGTLEYKVKEGKNMFSIKLPREDKKEGE